MLIEPELIFKFQKNVFAQKRLFKDIQLLKGPPYWQRSFGETITVLFKGKSGSVEKAVQDWKNNIEEIVEIASQMMLLVSRLGDEANKEINEKKTCM